MVQESLFGNHDLNAQEGNTCRYLDQKHQLYNDFEIWIHILQSFMPLNHFNKIDKCLRNQYMLQVDEILKHIVK
jgi:hypothetical protein